MGPAAEIPTLVVSHARPQLLGNGDRAAADGGCELISLWDESIGKNNGTSRNRSQKTSA